MQASSSPPPSTRILSSMAAGCCSPQLGTCGPAGVRTGQVCPGGAWAESYQGGWRGRAREDPAAPGVLSAAPGLVLSHLIRRLCASFFMGIGGHSPASCVSHPHPRAAVCTSVGVPESPVSSRPPVPGRGETPKVPLCYLITKCKSAFPECLL